MQIDVREPKLPLKEFAYNEARYRMLAQSNPQVAEELMGRAEKDIKAKWEMYQQIASRVPADVARDGTEPKETDQ